MSTILWLRAFVYLSLADKRTKNFENHQNNLLQPEIKYEGNLQQKKVLHLVRHYILKFEGRVTVQLTFIGYETNHKTKTWLRLFKPASTWVGLNKRPCDPASLDTPLSECFSSGAEAKCRYCHRHQCYYDYYPIHILVIINGCFCEVLVRV